MAYVYVCETCKDREYKKDPFRPGEKLVCPKCQRELMKCDLVAWRRDKVIKRKS